MTRRRSPAALTAWRRRFLERIGRSRAGTLALLATIPRAALERPRTQAVWSVRDVVAHVVAWEEEGTRRLLLIARGHPERIVWYETMADVDRFNAEVVRAARRLAWPRLLARLARARGDLVRALRRLPVPALADPGHALPVTGWLTEFALTHERGHRQAIRAWWVARRRRGARGARR